MLRLKLLSIQNKKYVIWHAPFQPTLQNKEDLDWEQGWGHSSIWFNHSAQCINIKLSANWLCHPGKRSVVLLLKDFVCGGLRLQVGYSICKWKNNFHWHEGAPFNKKRSSKQWPSSKLGFSMNGKQLHSLFYRYEQMRKTLINITEFTSMNN